MLNGRLYRAAFVPFLFVLAVAAFSLAPRPRQLTSTLAPDAFEGTRAFAEAKALASAYPQRRPGSRGDEALARRIARSFQGLGAGPAGGGFSVRIDHFEGETIDGSRSLSNVIAQRPGSTSATPIVILAHRDAAARGSAAELSGTAALLELARVFAARATKRTIILVSTSGGSGGDAGAAQLIGELQGPLDGAIVLGDLAGAGTRRPIVVPFSDGLGSAPLQLQRTVAAAITREAGADPGAPSALGQLVHLMFPLAVGEQGVLDASGVPSVLVQVSGERGPAPSEALGAERLNAYGRAVLSAVDSLDGAPDVSQSMATSIPLSHQTMPAWAVRLLVLALLFPPFVAGADGLARLRRRRLPVARWTLWAISCALPFMTAAVFAYLLARLGIIAAAPSVPVLPRALPFDGQAKLASFAVLLSFALAWLLWIRLVRRLGWSVRPDPDVAGLAVVLLLIAVALVVWLANPFTALLLVPATHLWLLLAAPELRPRRPGSFVLLVAGLAPLVLLIAFFAHQLGMGVGGTLWASVLFIAGGHIGMGSAILWSLALGGGAAAAMLTAVSPVEAPGPTARDDGEVTIRGPLSYAGPGSLGGTESALRR
jgi:hypothetical protein